MIGSRIPRGFLRSFQVRDFRLLWLSDGLGSWAEHTEFVVLAWYVLTVTDSPFMVGVFGALRFVGSLFAPFYGVLADRYDRARLFALVRTSALAIAGVVLALAAAGQLNVWYVFVLMTMAGIVRAAYIVTRQALIADQLQGERLMNGVALNRIAFNVAQLGGPAIGGVLLSRVGTIWAYVPVVVFNLLASLLAYAMRPTVNVTSGSPQSMWSNLVDAFSYIARHRVVLALLLMAFLVNLTAFPLNHGLMPVFARDVLGRGPTGLAALLAVYAAGALIGSTAIAVLRGLKRPGRVIVVATLAWHLGLILFAGSRWFSGSMVILLATGVTQSLTMVVMAMMLLGVTAPEVRGRVMGARSLAVYSLPLGLLVSGALADIFGAPAALAIVSVFGVVATLLITVGVRDLWRVA